MSDPSECNLERSLSPTPYTAPNLGSTQTACSSLNKSLNAFETPQHSHPEALKPSTHDADSCETLNWICRARKHPNP